MSEDINEIMKKDMEEIERANKKRPINVVRMDADEPGHRVPNVKEVADGRAVSSPESHVTVESAHVLSLMTMVAEECNWVDLGINVVAAACASTTPLFRINTQEDAEYKKKPRKKQIDGLTNLLQYPNLHQTGYDLFYYTYGALYQYGNAYWQVIRNRKGEPHSFYSLPPETMRVIPYIDKKNILHFAYYQHTATSERYFLEDEIIHFKMPNPKSFCYGKPVFYSQLMQVAASINAKRAIASWFEEGYVGGTVFKMEIDESAANRNRDYLKEMFTKPENFGKALLLEGGIELVREGSKFKDFDFSKLSSLDRDQILMSAGIPLSMAGVRSESGQANVQIVESEEKAFNRNVVDKMHNIVFGTINNKLFRQILKWDDVVMESGTLDKFSMTSAIEVARAASSLCGASANEIRDLLSMARVNDEDAGKIVLLTTNNGVIKAEDVIGVNFETGEKVETIFEKAQKMEGKAGELAGGSSGTGGKVKKLLEGS